MDGMFKLLYPFHQRVSIGLQLLRTHFHAFFFHIMNTLVRGISISSKSFSIPVSRSFSRSLAPP